MPYQAGLDRRICLAMGGAMSVAAATTVIGKHRATTTASNPDRRRRVRTAFLFLTPSLTDANYILRTS